MPAGMPSALPSFLSRRSALPVRVPDDGEPLRSGMVYLARPDHHPLAGDRKLGVVRGPAENGYRPAIDALFRSAAVAYGARVVAVVLTGALDDGAVGLAFVKRHGGIAVVQNPARCTAREHARERPRARVGGPCSTAGAGRAAARPVGAAAGGMGRRGEGARERPATSAVGDHHATNPERPRVPHTPVPGATPAERAAGQPTATPPLHPSEYSCPACGGVLSEVNEGELEHYRCRIGHTWSINALLASQGQALETAPWTALRSLEESAALRRQIGERLRERASRERAWREGQAPGHRPAAEAASQRGSSRNGT